MFPDYGHTERRDMDYQPIETRRSQPVMGEVLPARSVTRSVRARKVILAGCPGAPQAAAGGANIAAAANVMAVGVAALMVLLYVFGFGMAIVVAFIVGIVKASNKRR